MKIIRGLILLSLVFVSAYTDIRYRKIRNKYTIPSILFGIVLYVSESGLYGLRESLLGILAGFLLLLIPFLLRGMGAGDLKLLAAIGALKGPYFVILAFIYTAIVGGVLAIAYSVHKRGVLKSSKFFVAVAIAPIFKVLYQLTQLSAFGKIYVNMIGLISSDEEKLYIPYAIPIAIGTILVLLGLIPKGITV